MAQKYVIPILPRDSFSWSRWRSFDLFKILDMACRYDDIIKRKIILRQYAIGYIEAEKLSCRPKEAVAVMWLYNDNFSWCHLILKEFNILFGEEND